MPSPNVDALADNFEAIVEDQDIVGAATIGVAGAGGGAVAQQLAGRIVSQLGFDPTPTTPSGLLARGAVKMLVGAALGYAALQVGGTPGLALGVAGVGALIIGGGDWINAALTADVGVSAPRGQSPTTSRQRATVRSVEANRPTRSQNPDSNFQDEYEMEEGDTTAVQDLLA